MPRGPGLHPDVRMKITEMALDNRAEDRETLAKRILDDIIAPILNQRERPLPDLESIMKMISYARNHAPNPRDGVWTLGDCEAHAIPKEAIPAVLRVRKLCFIEGVPLSTRVAKWVARLSDVEERPMELRDWAYRYANREQAAVALGVPLDTADLDTLLTTSAWELATAYATGLASDWHLEIANPCLEAKGLGLESAALYQLSRKAEYALLWSAGSPGELAVDDQGSQRLALLVEVNPEFAANTSREDILQQLDTKLQERLEEVFGAGNFSLESSHLEQLDSSPVLENLGLENIADFGLSPAAMAVYIFWLSFLRKAEARPSLDVQLEIIVLLRRWVQSQDWASDSAAVSTFAESVGVENLRELSKHPGLRPVDILQLAGLSGA